MLAHYDASDYCVRIGASVRMVIDVSAWDNCVLINAPGQSGIPGAPHYYDLAPLWVAGNYVPMAYSTKTFEEATHRILTLRPG